MEFVKKNLISLICGVVALVAVVAWQWPIGGMYDTTRDEMKKRESVYGQIGRYQKTQRLWPVIPKFIAGEKTQPQLTQFPSEPYIKAGASIKDRVRDQATGMDKDGRPTGMKEKTESANKHDLLVPGVLPVPKDLGFKFQPEYLDQVQKVLPRELVDALMISVTGAPTGGSFTLVYHGQTTVPIPFNATAPVIQAALQALPPAGGSGSNFPLTVTGQPGGPWDVKPVGAELAVGPTAFVGGTSPAVSLTALAMPPIETDIRAEADRLWRKEYKNKIFAVAGKDVNRPAIEDEWQKRCVTLQSILRLKRAGECKLYLEPEAISVAKSMTKGGGIAPDAKDIWYAQTMLWVQQDIVTAIKRINENSPDVIHSPIKHIYKLNVADGVAQFVVPVSGGEPAGKAYSRMPTGRIGNPVYDVVQFNIDMDVEAAKIPFILAQLQQGKLITIQQFDVAHVDGIAMEDDGFIYGKVPVVKMTLRGEELLLRSWTNPKEGVSLMPDDVKKELGASQNSAPQ